MHCRRLRRERELVSDRLAAMFGLALSSLEENMFSFSNRYLLVIEYEMWPQIWRKKLNFFTKITHILLKLLVCYILLHMQLYEIRLKVLHVFVNRQTFFIFFVSLDRYGALLQVLSCANAAHSAANGKCLDWTEKEEAGSTPTDSCAGSLSPTREVNSGMNWMHYWSPPHSVKHHNHDFTTADPKSKERYECQPFVKANDSLWRRANVSFR